MEPDSIFLNWQSLASGALMLLKFFFGNLTPMAQPEQVTSVPTHGILAVLRVEERESSAATAKILERRLQVLGASGTIVQAPPDRLEVTLTSSQGQDELLGQLLAPGRLEVRHLEDLLLGNSDFEGANEKFLPESSAFIKSVGASLTEAGSTKWTRATTDLVGEETEIILDGQVITTPKIMVPMTGKEFLLTGPEIPVSSLILYINTGALPTEVKLLELRVTEVP